MSGPGSQKIIYSLVARGQVVLAEYSAVTGNVNVIAVRILEKLPHEDTHVTYTQERHMFHVIVSEGFTYLAVAEEAFGRRIPFAFLDDVRNRFMGMYGAAAKEAVAYEYNTEFGKVLGERAAAFSDPSSDVISRMQGQLQEVKHIMIENIEKVLERGERLDLLVDKTEGLQQVSLAFRQQARRLKHTLWWKNARLWLVISGATMALIYLIVAMVCGFSLRHC
ncbi:hypothetical protein VOLCADRAFT_54976 [Volvox carteri f. nagariensis]|uniref:Uncharacterized protein vamp75 n=1 Tax=Volvox carteri f. nagariensis TaxID=3068 RepID=D8TIJ9_VOLCA|nr:uncharacterized protein VOLCADRAFT_54976 [Volvox carteri f. nagariensis]EFJ53256.1 hypothetical protein VOLCADRAFT_54976 [Volvox carteri f. nagariensis]|eukprot:XP_002946261.1 hypothetical protein VOLCADRAFT_54976 [Volvox carteri f. nagariensis]